MTLFDSVWLLCITSCTSQISAANDTLVNSKFTSTSYVHLNEHTSRHLSLIMPKTKLIISSHKKRNKQTNKQKQKFVPEALSLVQGREILYYSKQEQFGE